jgi:Ca2+-binding RTX toxin-like protein
MNDHLYGGDGNDTLSDSYGNNVLDGGAGADQMTGGYGDDTFVVDVAGDVVVEQADSGTDTVQSSITYTLGANLENLTLTGAAAINGTGNTLANVLTGNDAANILVSGTGADTMIGGLGEDTYTVDNVNDVIVENAGEGLDRVNSSVSYTLSAEVENLTLTGTTAINGTGNVLAHGLTGNSAANVLTGGAGNDTYIVGTGDTTTEAAGGGIDTVQSAVTWTLGTEVENLTLTGTAAINGTGNTSANLLIGNSAANALSGGTGADTMIGGAGDDIYTVDDAGDVVTELAGEGKDLVNASLTYTFERERGEPHADRNHGDQQHRQCAGQRADRQQRGERVDRRRG